MKSFFALVLSVSFAFAMAVRAAEPIVLSPAEGAKEGKELVARMTSLRPERNTASTGTLVVKQSRTQEISIPVRFEVKVSDDSWLSTYEAPGLTNGISTLVILRKDTESARVEVVGNENKRTLSGNETMTPFAGTDFWVADLSLEFLSWPQQRVLRKEIRRSQSCSVLESTNPNPARGAYARVVSWVDIDTGGIINAEAYGTDGKRMKEFVAQKFKKVHGQWEVKQIEMNDRRTGSRTTLIFDLGQQ
jgi:hypothetical protein